MKKEENRIADLHPNMEDPTPQGCFIDHSMEDTPKIPGKRRPPIKTPSLAKIQQIHVKHKIVNNVKSKGIMRNVVRQFTKKKY